MILQADTICSQAVKFPKALCLFSGKLGNSCYPFSHTLQQINKFELHIGFTCDGKADVLTDIKVFPFVWCSLSKQMVGSYQVSAVKSIGWRNHSLVTKIQIFKKEKLPGLKIFLVWYLRMKQTMENWQLPDLLMWSAILQAWAAAAAKLAPSKALLMVLNVAYQVGFKTWYTLLCSSKKETVTKKGNYVKKLGSLNIALFLYQTYIIQFSLNSKYNNIPNLMDNLPETINFFLFNACRSILAQGCVLSDSAFAWSKSRGGFPLGTSF